MLPCRPRLSRCEWIAAGAAVLPCPSTAPLPLLTPACSCWPSTRPPALATCPAAADVSSSVQLGICGSLGFCAVLYALMAAVITGMVKYTQAGPYVGKGGGMGGGRGEDLRPPAVCTIVCCTSGIRLPLPSG